VSNLKLWAAVLGALFVIVLIWLALDVAGRSAAL
jgi:hypothetical protein